MACWKNSAAGDATTKTGAEKMEWQTPMASTRARRGNGLGVMVVLATLAVIEAGCAGSVLESTVPGRWYTSNQVNQGQGVFQTHCAVCHGLPDAQKTAIAQGMFPVPPQLFDHTVTDDPEGETYWKVTHGIRLSGMPGFGKTLSENERWQVTMFLAHVDKLPAAAKDALK